MVGTIADLVVLPATLFLVLYRIHVVQHHAAILTALAVAIVGGHITQKCLKGNCNLDLEYFICDLSVVNILPHS